MGESDINTRVPHPGSFIEEELEARGWSQTDLAYILGMSVQSINPIISGRRGISTDMAKAFGEAFDVSAELFTNLQAAYDHSIATKPDPSISRRARLQQSFPIRDMIKRGWLGDDGDISLLEAQMMRFFRTEDLDAIPYLSHRSKKTRYARYEERDIPPSQLAWLFRVQQIAREMSVGNFSASALQGCLNELKTLLSDPAEIRHVPKILSECGVRYVLVERLPNASIDGVCFWLDKKNPVIGMSLRFDRIDNFWFVLRHEIEHVLKKHGQKDEIFDDLTGEKSGQSENLPPEERIANAAAADFCTPSEQLKSFIQRKFPYLGERDILGFSRRLQIHPGIVIGQIHDKTQNYRLLRKYLVKIQDYIVPYSVCDGWGETFPITM